MMDIVFIDLSVKSIQVHFIVVSNKEAVSVIIYPKNDQNF